MWRSFLVNLILCRGEADSVLLHVIQMLLLFSQIVEIHHRVCVCVHTNRMCQTNTLVCSTHFVKYYLINCHGVVSVDIQE